MKKILRFKCGKLVRDNIPQLCVEKDNSTAGTRVLTSEEYKLALKKKLLEEAQEVVDANTQLDVKEELADVLEIVHAMATIHELTFGEIENARCLKAQKNGGFAGHLYLEYIDIQSDNLKVEYYLSNPDKYPLIKETTQ